MAGVAKGKSTLHTARAESPFAPAARIRVAAQRSRSAARDDGGRRILPAPASGDLYLVGQSVPNWPSIDDAVLAVARIDTAGHLVAAYGQGGKVLVEPFDARIAATSATFDARGSLYAAGSWFNGMHVVKLRPNGQLDTGFGQHGRATIEVQYFSGGTSSYAAAGIRTLDFTPRDQVQQIAFDPLGRLLAAGEANGAMLAVRLALPVHSRIFRSGFD